VAILYALFRTFLRFVLYYDIKINWALGLSTLLILQSTVPLVKSPFKSGPSGLSLKEKDKKPAKVALKGTGSKENAATVNKQTDSSFNSLMGLEFVSNAMAVNLVELSSVLSKPTQVRACFVKNNSNYHNFFQYFVSSS